MSTGFGGGEREGVVEHGRTGEKIRVETLADVGSVLAAMLARDSGEATAVTR